MKLFKNIAKWTLLAVLISLIVFVLWIRGQYVVPILMYHHVRPSPVKDLNNSSPLAFEKQMAFLKKYNYNVLSLDEYFTIKKSAGTFPRNSVVITFDDGYDNNYTNAFPILKKYNFPATIFVISDYVDHESFLTWKQIQEMSREGFTIGSHTRQHSYLPNVLDEESHNQIVGSKRIIEEKLGKKVNYIAYPTGGFTQAVKDIAKSAGYVAAFTTNRGKDKSNQDLYELKRIRVNNKDSLLTLYAKFSGYYNVFRATKESHTDDDLGYLYKK
jgi:peptidoglycan/xylan/chitin deacetylase (PgdA/CDA1 family)